MGTYLLFQESAEHLNPSSELLHPLSLPLDPLHLSPQVPLLLFQGCQLRRGDLHGMLVFGLGDFELGDGLRESSLDRGNGWQWSSSGYC
jgi:hypothetical protein